MELKVNNEKSFVEVKKITIRLDDGTELRIRMTNQNRLLITKNNDDNQGLLLHPVVSNQVEIF